MRIKLTISEEEALQRLKDNLNTEKEPERILIGFRWALDKVMYGKLDENKFWAYDLIASDCASKETTPRQITGSVSTENGKTVVDYKFGFTMYNYGFFFAIYVILIVMCGLKGSSSEGLVLLIITLFYLAVVLFILGTTVLFGRKYKKCALEHFRNIFADCIDEEDNTKNEKN